MQAGGGEVFGEAVGGVEEVGVDGLWEGRGVAGLGGV